MFQNSKTRYFMCLTLFFLQRSWSFGLGVSFRFSCKLRAPTLCDPTCWPSCHFLTVQNLGAFILNWHLFSSSSLGKCKNAKNATFLTRNPYRLGSFQLEARNMSKIESFLENTVFYAIKLIHPVLHNFPGARTLIYLFPWSSVMICTKTVELATGIFFVKITWSSELKMLSFLGIQTIISKNTRILRNKIILEIPKYGF